MTNLEFIASLVDSLSWPVCSLAIGLILRDAYLHGFHDCEDDLDRR